MPKNKRKKKQNFRLTPASIAVTVLLAMVFTVYAVFAYQRTGTVVPTMELLDGHANFRFIDVGQGDCTLITHGGNGILIDAGPGSAGKRAAEEVALYSPTLDYFIITHPHEDHMGGAAEILRRVKVDCLVLTTDRVEDEFYYDTVTLADKLGIPVLYAEEELVLTAGTITAEIFDTFDLVADDLNDRSIAAKITADGTTLLVTGDAETLEEEYLLAHYGAELDADLLQVGHHGSSTSSGEAFLEAVSPETAVISCGRNNTYGHPTSEVVARLRETGAEIRRTDYEGTVLLRNGHSFQSWLRSLNPAGKP